MKEIAWFVLLVVLSLGWSRNTVSISTSAKGAFTEIEKPKPDALSPPVPITVQGKPLRATYIPKRRFDANSWPWFGDFDADGKLDLLVGQGWHGKSHDGHLRVYRNLAASGKPRLAKPFWFHDRHTSGRIPHG